MPQTLWTTITKTKPQTVWTKQVSDDDAPGLAWRRMSLNLFKLSNKSNMKWNRSQCIRRTSHFNISTKSKSSDGSTFIWALHSILSFVRWNSSDSKAFVGIFLFRKFSQSLSISFELSVSHFWFVCKVRIAFLCDYETWRHCLLPLIKNACDMSCGEKFLRNIKLPTKHDVGIECEAMSARSLRRGVAVSFQLVLNFCCRIFRDPLSTLARHSWCVWPSNNLSENKRSNKQREKRGDTSSAEKA